MGHRIALTAGLAAFTLAVLRLNRLLETPSPVPEWAAIALASALLGALLWWLLDQVISNSRLALTLHGLLALLLLVRVSVPSTLIAGVLPSATTPETLARSLGQALDLIRFSVPPAMPSPGVLGLLAMVMWLVGTLFAWGATRGPLWATVIPSMVVYFQFAVFDRGSAGLGWTAAIAATMAFTAAAFALHSPRGIGAMTTERGSSLRKRSPGVSLSAAGVVAVAAFALANSVVGIVPQYGNVPWRTDGSGYGIGGGGVAFNPLVDLRQRIINRTNQVLFRATLGEGAPPPDQIYWRMDTLDIFDGEAWRPSTGSITSYQPGEVIGVSRDIYRGTTAELLQLVRIEALRGELVPVAGITQEIQTAPGGIRPAAFQVSPNASIIYPSGLRRGDMVQVAAVLPLYETDLGVLARGTDGELSPLFANAAEAGVFQVAGATPARQSLPPPDLGFYTKIPDDLPTAIRDIALERTRGATTDFERAWMLQYWFRDSGDFTYSTDVSTGHSALRLEEWLADPRSRNYRIGYCEQFAASMAVLGRALGIPSRVVWGFTPGTTVVRDGVEVIEIRDTNAHAWVEMWMEGVGWVRFDPTPRGEFQPESLTAAFDPTAFTPEPDTGSSLQAPVPDEFRELRTDPAETLLDTPTSNPGFWLWVIAALLTLGLVAPAAKSLRRRWRLRRIRTGDIIPVWEEIVDRLVDVGEPVDDALTPVELATRSDQMLVPIAARYSAVIYGGGADAAETDFETVERWFRLRYPRTKRVWATLTPRSLLPRR
ncbi:MAG: transglutaminaseTgpA domain-containing protein [Acidimicrobiia bacterium]